MLRDQGYLVDIANAAKRIASYLDGMNLEEFLQNAMARAAVVREIEIMGEAANLLSEEFRAAHPDVPWKRVTIFRNFYIHGYRTVNYSRVWKTAQGFIPRIYEAVSILIDVEKSESSTPSEGSSKQGS